MKLDKKERVILINQYRILAALNPEEKSRYMELIEVLENGYEIFYSMVDQWVSEEMPEAECKFVLDILNLYRTIEDKKRTTQDQNLVEHHYSYFRGFDGNEETEYMAFARFLIETQGKFQEQEQYLLKNDNLNSHFPMKEKYRAMLNRAGKAALVRLLTVEKIISILDADQLPRE